MSEYILCLEEACSEVLDYGEDFRKFHKDHYGHKSKFLDDLQQDLIEEKNKLVDEFNQETLLTNVDLMVAGFKKDFEIKIDIFANELKSSIQSIINLDRGVGLYLSINSKDMTKIIQYSDIFHMLKDPPTIIQQYRRNIIDVQEICTTKLSKYSLKIKEVNTLIFENYHLKNKAHQVFGRAKIFSEFVSIYYLAYRALAVIGTVVHPFFFSFHLTEILTRYPTLKNVVRSVYEL